MAKAPQKRLRNALQHAGDLAQQIEAALPPPRPRRNKRILVSWSDEEYRRIGELAEERDGEALAVVVRNLTMAALDAMGK